MNYEINIAKYYETTNYGGGPQRLYRHHSRVHFNTGFEKDARALFTEYVGLFPEPEFKLELSRRTSYSEIITPTE